VVVMMTLTRGALTHLTTGGASDLLLSGILTGTETGTGTVSIGFGSI
jgi:hypothetical protein